MKRFLLALAVLAIVSLHSAFSADGSFASPYDLGLINGSAYFSMSGLTVGQAAKYYSFGIYTTAPAGATMDVAFVSPTGDPMYVLALYSGSTKILSGKFVTTDGSNYLSQVTLVSPLVSGEYLLQVGEAGSAIGTTGSAFTIDFNLQNYSAPAVLHAPINQSPANGAVDCATTSLLLQATPYSQNNTTGYAVTTEWVMRRTTDNAVVLNATVSGGADSVHVTDLVPGRRYSWQVRYANETNAWTPFSTPTVFTAATVWPPQISVSTINALAVEAPLYQGVVRVSRTTTTGARTVKLKIGGTALPGVDYQTIPASLTIPAGAHFVDIPIVPTGTSAFVGKQSVTIAAQAVTGFAVQSSPAVLSIRSNLLPQRLVVREGNSYLFDLTGTGGTPGKSVVFGNGREKVLYGDFTGAGADTLLLNSGTTYSLALGVSGSVSAQTFHFGPSGKQTPFIADYDGKGHDNLIVRSGNVFHVLRHVGDGARRSSFSFTFGNPGDELVLRSDGVRSGDWDGDGHDDIFLRRGNLFLVRLSRTGTVVQFRFGDVTSKAFLADLNGDGKVEPVLWNRKHQYTADIHHNETSPLVLSFGNDKEFAYAADLAGNGRDELFLRRGNEFLIDSGHNGGVAEEKITFGQPGDKLWMLRQ